MQSSKILNCYVKLPIPFLIFQHLTKERNYCTINGYIEGTITQLVGQAVHDLLTKSTSNKRDNECKAIIITSNEIPSNTLQPEDSVKVLLNKLFDILLLINLLLSQGPVSSWNCSGRYQILQEYSKSWIYALPITGCTPLNWWLQAFNRSSRAQLWIIEWCTVTKNKLHQVREWLKHTRILILLL